MPFLDTEMMMYFPGKMSPREVRELCGRTEPYSRRFKMTVELSTMLVASVAGGVCILLAAYMSIWFFPLGLFAILLPQAYIRMRLETPRYNEDRRRLAIEDGKIRTTKDEAFQIVMTDAVKHRLTDEMKYISSKMEVAVDDFFKNYYHREFEAHTVMWVLDTGFVEREKKLLSDSALKRIAELSGNENAFMEHVHEVTAGHYADAVIKTRNRRSDAKAWLKRCEDDVVEAKRRVTMHDEFLETLESKMAQAVNP